MRVSKKLKAAAAAVTIAATGATGVLVQTSSGSLEKDGVCTLKGGDLSGKPPADADDVAMSEAKNRYEIPGEEDFAPHAYTSGSDSANDAWSTLIHYAVREHKTTPGEDKTVAGKAFRVHAWVVDVVEGGVETCNCKQTEPEHRDVHIYLSLVDMPKDKIDKSECVIVEVTPRVRKLLHHDDDWTANQIKASMLHKPVDVEGWLFYDWEHVPNSKREGGKGALWRKTCWEIHPVTNLALASDETVPGKAK